MPRYIDADKLMKDIRQRAYLTDNIVERPIYAMTVLGIQQTVDEQPIISPDEVRGVGKWIDCPSTHIQDGAKYRMCSVCNEHIAVLGHDLIYCPNCGARMSSAEAEKAMEGEKT